MTGPVDDRPPVGPELERRLREALAREDARGEARERARGVPGNLPSPEALLDALAGRLPENERVRVIDQAARTAEGRRELATLRVALGAAESAWPAAGSDAGMRRASWWLRPGAAAAAAVLLAAGLGGGVWWQMMHASPNAPADADPLRSAGAGAGVALVAPEVEAAAGVPTVLAWRAVPGATAYDVEVLTSSGAVVHAASTRDTTLALPAAAAPAAGASYDWWVRARVPGGEARRSPTGRLRGR